MDILQKVLAHDFDPSIQIRGFVKLLWRTPHYQEEFHRLSPSFQSLVQTFLDDSTSGADITSLNFSVIDHHASKSGASSRVIGRMSNHKPPLLFEDQSKHISIKQVIHKEQFQNWGQNLSNTPLNTFFPTTVLGVQNVVLYAIKKNFRVRCASYRHSWAPIFGEKNEILISFVDHEQVTTVPDPVTIIARKFTGQSADHLKSVELVGGADPGKQFLRAGAAVTKQARISDDGSWIANGRTEYIDCKGELQSVDITTPDLLSTAAGNFGLLGIITYLMFEIEPMSYAIMKPRKVDIGLAVLPIRKKDIPEALRNNSNQLDPEAGWYSAINSAAQFENAVQDFEKRAINDHYCEWFWAPYQKKGWVQTWNVESSPDGDTAYPDPWLTFLQ
ncbi:hypothetical protein FKW77_006731 [Venturia effusa]|uniref:FAD-binding PCMH-type domain-containing protein n=1 Tax=Venturia effusa TaxID=50376 RepID=A0A517LQC9_9PEZI|nr:hypothetical protein FKW77_006731 [Venturia effusa]